MNVYIKIKKRITINIFLRICQTKKQLKLYLAELLLLLLLFFSFESFSHQR